MRVLYASHKGLPDQRIEREAYIAKATGHKIDFLGMGNKVTPELKVFENIEMLPSINNRQVVLDKSIRNKWARAIERADPDIVHASDIIAARYTSLTEWPMVYDDHEYWSAQRIIYQSWPIWKRYAIRPFLKVIPEWEHRLLEKHVTITVSEGIAEEHRRICAHVFVLQNYGLSVEVQGLPVKPNRSGVVYVGNDFLRKRFTRHRDMTGLRDYLEFDALSGLPRDELYLRLIAYRVGLLPFKANPYSKYANSAKTFDYLNCGLQVLMTEPLYSAHGELPYTYPFDKYSEIPDLLKSMEKADPAEIMTYAHENFTWESQQDTLFEAYRISVEQD